MDIVALFCEIDGTFPNPHPDPSEPHNLEALVQMDAGRLAFADASFDKVALMFALSGLPDPLRAVGEMQRVCRPGGTIVIVQHFRTGSALMRACELLLEPAYRVMRYRGDMDLERFLAAAKLDVVETRRTNLFGYATLLTCVNRAPHVRLALQRAAVREALATKE